MTKNTKTKDRSFFTTITAGILGLLIAIVTILILPISNVVEAFSFAIGVLLFIICVVTAIDGKKGTIQELIYSLTYWK